MGTEITLDVGGLSLTYSRNSVGMDHGALFQEGDRQQVNAYLSDEEDYPGGGKGASVEMAFTRKLRQIVPRLELRGFTLERVRQSYDDIAAKWRLESDFDVIDEEIQGVPPPDPMTFEEYREYVVKHALKNLDNTEVFELDEAGKQKIIGRFTDHDANYRLPYFDAYNDQGYSELSHFGELINFMHPYATLRLLAENSANLECDVVWQYGALVRNGWAEASEFKSGARRRQTFLIATEGSSDVHILTHSFAVLRPEIADFFRFIDVSERHPFSGTGNLLKFAEGLAKIDVQNQTLFVFDNDAEGYEAHTKLTKLSLPSNMRAIVLPELSQFDSFPASGPQGVTNTNINRRAAAIECYLDLRRGDYPEAKIVWTNLKIEPDIYQGALAFKESYMREFFKQSAQSLLDGSYDVSKLHAVLDAIVAESCKIADAEIRWSFEY